MLASSLHVLANPKSQILMTGGSWLHQMEEILAVRAEQGKGGLAKVADLDDRRFVAVRIDGWEAERELWKAHQVKRHLAGGDCGTHRCPKPLTKLCNRS